MSVLGKSIRAMRFNTLPDSPILLTVESKTGAKFKLRLENCSLTGVGGSLDGTTPANEGLDIGEILPAAKLHWEGYETSLGRLVLRTIQVQDQKTFVGFSTVDGKVPVDGPLSRFLEKTGKQDKSPYDFELSADKFSLANFVESDNNNIDLFGKCNQFEIFFKDWTDKPRYLYRTIRTASKGTRVQLKQKRRGKRNDYIVMGSNDYLGLAANPEVLEAAKKAITDYGFGSTGSPLTTGNTDIHEELEDFIAKTFRKEKVLLFNSGYTVNVGCMQGLTSANDMILSDMIAHASLQDGMKMAKAQHRFFKHNDVKHLQKMLEEHRNQVSGCLIVTEGVFSMDGDVPPLEEIVKLAKKYNARTFIDEAHSYGVVGPHGMGACEKFDVLDQIDLVMGTFSKIAGGIGGFVAGPKSVMDWLYWNARSRVFSVSIPPSTAAAALKALQIFHARPELHAQLRENIRRFVSGLTQMGYPINPNHESAVIPVVIGNEAALGKINERLLDAGVYVVPVVYPAVSRNGCRFRFTVTAEHTLSDIDYVTHVLETAVKDIGFSFASKEEKETSSLETIKTNKLRVA